MSTLPRERMPGRRLGQVLSYPSRCRRYMQTICKRFFFLPHKKCKYFQFGIECSSFGKVFFPRLYNLCRPWRKRRYQYLRYFMMPRHLRYHFLLRSSTPPLLRSSAPPFLLLLFSSAPLLLLSSFPLLLSSSPPLLRSSSSSSPPRYEPEPELRGEVGGEGEEGAGSSGEKVT